MDSSFYNGKYKVIKTIGSGGFGEVYLAESPDGAFVALKKIVSPKGVERELGAVRKYAKISERLSDANVVKISDISVSDGALFYVMPLSDGLDGLSPLDENWQPDTLQARIDARRRADKWFSRAEVVGLFLPVVRAADALGKAGVLHRDIKPQNILFFGGKPFLADVGLLTEDRLSASSAGTPFYSAPTWYSSNRGNPDMWGIAATFFTLLTGNLPDLIGRSAYLVPPQGKDTMSTLDIFAWDGFMAVINRATDEDSTERYLRLSDIARDISDIADNPSCWVSESLAAAKSEPPARPESPKKHLLLPLSVGAVGVMLLAVVAFAVIIFNKSGQVQLEPPATETLQTKTEQPSPAQAKPAQAAQSAPDNSVPAQATASVPAQSAVSAPVQTSDNSAIFAARQAFRSLDKISKGTVPDAEIASEFDSALLNMTKAEFGEVAAANRQIYQSLWRDNFKPFDGFLKIARAYRKRGLDANARRLADIFVSACASGLPVLDLNKDDTLELAEYFEALGDKQAMNALKDVVSKYIDQMIDPKKRELDGLLKVRDTRFAARGLPIPASFEKRIGDLNEKVGSQTALLADISKRAEKMQ